MLWKQRMKHVYENVKTIVKKNNNKKTVNTTKNCQIQVNNNNTSQNVELSEEITPFIGL